MTNTINTEPIANVRVFDPSGDGFTESTIPTNVKELYTLLKGVRSETGNGLMSALARCISTSIALQEFELLGGFDVVYNESTGCWDAKLMCVYSSDGERTTLSPALSIMTVCVASANGVVPDFDCMRSGKSDITVGDRVGRYRPVSFCYTPETNMAVDVTRAVVLVSSGLVARYRGSYDIASGEYRDRNENVVKVDEILLKLGGGV